MAHYTYILVTLLGFVVLALASRQVGEYFKRVKLPLISGFLAAGMLIGPYGLEFISSRAVESLRFVDQVALAFIAFAAGSELRLKELKDRFKSIGWVTAGLVVSTFFLGATTVFLLADLVPFARGMSLSGRVAVSLLAGAILVARSPSSAIAIVKELRAKGPFTHTVLGVTVIMDVVVIVLFGFCSSLADTLLSGYGFDLYCVFVLLFELALSVAAGLALGQLLRLVFCLRVPSVVKNVLVLLIGYGIFLLADVLGPQTHHLLGFEFSIEPLLVCVLGGFWITNFGINSVEFEEVIHEFGPPVYVAFFTLTGASLALDILVDTWHIALALFGVRLFALFVGSLTGGAIAGEPGRNNRISWMAYVTQAGIGLGLAKGVVVVFPEWGAAFATMIISVIVANQIVGPPLFKWVIHIVGESHERADVDHFDGVRDAVIFGLEGQSLALARQLESHGWVVRIACRGRVDSELLATSGIDVRIVPDFSPETFVKLELDRAEAIVAMMSDEENYAICETVFEHFGTGNMVVRLNDMTNWEHFHDLGALIVQPSTAMVGLLDHSVRSPLAAALILGMEKNQDIIELEVRDPLLHGKAVRELHLPLDTLVVSVSRDGHMLVSHGFTRLHLGDHVTIVGSEDSLDEVTLMFDAE